MESDNGVFLFKPMSICMPLKMTLKDWIFECERQSLNNRKEKCGDELQRLIKR